MPSPHEENFSASSLKEPATKPCRSCVDFRSWMKMQSPQTKDIGKTQKSLEEKKAEASPTINDESTNESKSNNSADNIKSADETKSNLWGQASKDGCPADVESLGIGSWRLLHTIAANYPDMPTDTKQKDMKNFIGLFSQFYPCPPCAEDFRDWLTVHPPEVASNFSLSQYFCRAHNEVNRKLGKDEFDCQLVHARWKTGWKDGSCG